MTDLTARLADVLADAAEDHGTHDHHAQATAALTWLQAEQGRLITTDQLIELGNYPLLCAELGTQVEILEAERDELRALFGLRLGEQVCAVPSLLTSDYLDAMSCLRPSGHDGRHASIGGTWAL